MPDSGDVDPTEPDESARPQGEPEERFGGVKFAFFLVAVLVAIGIWQFVTNGFDDVDPNTCEPVVENDRDDDGG